MQKRSEIWAEKDTKELIKKYKKDLKIYKIKIFLFQADMAWHLAYKKR